MNDLHNVNVNMNDVQGELTWLDDITALRIRVEAVKRLEASKEGKDILYAANGLQRSVSLRKHHAVSYNLQLHIQHAIDDYRLFDKAFWLDISSGLIVTGAIWRDLASEDDIVTGRISGEFHIFLVDVD